MMKKIIGGAILLVVLLFAGCIGQADVKPPASNESNFTNGSQLANPASVKCVNDGGQLEIVKEKEGEYGICKFKNGAQCEEWAYFRGECSPEKPNYCVEDKDCACGVHIETGECFVGSKEFVNTEKQCPDYCTGIAGNLETKCINHQCKIVKKTEKPGFCGWSTNGPCQNNDDCIVGGCSGQVCQSKNEPPVVTTCEYSDCYDRIAYGVACKCVENKCKWIAKTFN